MTVWNQKKSKKLKNQKINIVKNISVIGLIFLLFACNNKPAGVLSQRKMTNILTDLHILEGSLAAKGINYNEFDLKSKYYNSVLEKYGVTEAQFDSSVVWYTKNPKEYDDIYEKVYTRVVALEEDVKKGKYHAIDSTETQYLKLNIWNKPIHYVFTKDSTRTHLDFEFKNSSFLYGDIFTLKFLQRIAPEDSCENQFVLFCVNYSNGKSDSTIAASHNDSLQRRYYFRIPLTQKLKVKSISGELLGSKKYKGKFNVTMDSISLTRQFNPKIQDSLRAIVEKADPIKYTLPKKENLDSLNRIRKNIPIRTDKKLKPGIK